MKNNIIIPTLDVSLQCGNCRFVKAEWCNGTIPVEKLYFCWILNEVKLREDCIQVDEKQIKISIAFCKMTDRVVVFGMYKGMRNDKPLYGQVPEEKFWKSFNPEIGVFE